VEFDDLKHLREQQKGGKDDRLQTPRDAHLAARAQSLEVGAIEATAQGVAVEKNDRDAGQNQVDDASAQAATLHAFSGTARALPHAELVGAAFGKHSVADVQAHTDDRAQAGLEAMDARGLAGADRVVLAADADVAETAREAALALAKQAEAAGQVGPTEDADRMALVDAIAERTAQGRDAEDLLDHLTREAGAGGEQGALGGSSAGWDGVGAGEVRGDVAQTPEEDATEGELSPAEIEAARLEAEQAAVDRQAGEALGVPSWFERLAGAEAQGASAQNHKESQMLPAFDPPALQARRRKRVGEGWLFNLPAGPSAAVSHASAGPQSGTDHRGRP
jgi:hypothetical protein